MVARDTPVGGLPAAVFPGISCRSYHLSSSLATLAKVAAGSFNSSGEIADLLHRLMKKGVDQWKPLCWVPHCGTYSEAFQIIATHRDAATPLPAALCIAVAAMLAGRTSLSAIRRWASRLRPEALREMGIWRGRAPSQGAWHYILRDLSIRDLESALGAWVGAARLDGQPLHVASDGKTARGSAGGESPPLHVLAAYCEPLRGVLGQWRVEPGENEIVTALRMLRELPLAGLIVTGDAIFAQREILPPNHGRRRRLLLRGQRQSTRFERAYQDGLHAAHFPPRKSARGCVRLTMPRRATAATAVLRYEAWSVPNALLGIWTGRGWLRSVAFAASGSRGRGTARRPSMRSPACRENGAARSSSCPCRAGTVARALGNRKLSSLRSGRNASGGCVSGA